MSYNVLGVSRYIINYCNENYYLISNLKLQKILYFVQAFFLEAKNEECFREEIEAWDFGPVVPEVYREYRKYGGDANKYLEVGYKEIAKAIVDALDNHVVTNPIVSAPIVETKPVNVDEWVRELQHECNKQGFSNQKVDGIAGPATLAGCPKLRKGASGNITKLLQEKLVKLGYNTNGVDGIFGSGTYTAVREFQKTREITADGIVGQDTWRNLLNL